MRTARAYAVVLALAVLIGLMAGLLTAQEPMKTRHHLPTGWSKGLKLTSEQKAQIYKLQDDNAVKVAALQKQISDIRADERKAMVAILTDGQKAALRKMLGVE